MAKSRKLEDTLVALTQIRNDPTSETGLATLHQILKSKYSVAVAQAAKLIGESEIHSLIPDLVTAFNRLMVNAKETDPSCLAKKAIAEALYRLEYSEETLFLQGIRHVQMEPVWGGQEDTAPGLRGTCALGLVRMNYPQVLSELADLLADPKPEARIGAARAIAYTSNDQGAPLLRLRVQIGDELPVLSECLIALLKLTPGQSLALVESFLYVKEPSGFTEAVGTAEAAALALGESRLAEAFDVLQRWWEKVKNADLRETGLLAIAMLRSNQALDFLLSLIVEGKSQDAKGALKALSLYQKDGDLWRRVRQAVEQRGEASLLETAIALQV